MPKPKVPAEEREDPEREYTLSISEESRQYSFDLEDERWRHQGKDWLKLAVATVFWAGFKIMWFFFVPGIK